MKVLTLISRTLTLTPSPSPTRLPFPHFHSIAGEESHRRRAEPLPSPRWRNYDEENRAAKVTAWWDFENCSVPSSVNVERVACRITSAIRSAGIKGPVTITAFGDVVQMSRAAQEALTSTGVCLNHVPQRGKNSSDRSFMADLVYWVTQNPPPAHFFLISSDKDFANILHRLRMSNYNILLSSRDSVPVLCSAATVMWPWVGLVKGENVTAKHFNHPPDGLHGSWYGHHKGLLDDPFPNSEQCSVPKSEESIESMPETKNHPVPKGVVNAIRNVLHSYPEGITISELRTELKRKNVAIDKDFYGYKKFSNLLSSMSTVVKFIPNSLGPPLVTDRRAVGSAERSSKCAKEMETTSLDKVPTSISDEKSLTRDDNSLSVAPRMAPVDTVPAHAMSNVDISADLSTSQQVNYAAADEELLGRKEAIPEPPKAGQVAKVREGLLKRIWTTLTGARA